MNNCIPFPGSIPGAADVSGTSAIDPGSSAALRWGWFDQLYFAVMGVHLMQWQLEELESIDQSEDVATLALYATREAPRPSFWYLRSILIRCAAEGVKTREAWYQRQRRHKLDQDRCY